MALIRYALDPWLGDRHPLSLLFGAVALAVWYGGTGPGVLATVLGYIVSDYLFTPPRGVVAIVDATELVGLLTYLISCTAIVGFGAGMRAANRRARRYAQMLEQKQQQLELAERRKDEFISVVAHELRNPLSSIRNALALLGRGNGAHEPGKNVIGRQTGQLVRLVEDLLDVSRIREGRVYLQKRVVGIDSILNDAILTARPQIEAAEHTLRVSLPSGPLVVEADPGRLVQVFANLLSNAARYTPRGGQITLKARREGEQAVVSVQDNGIGIPPDMLNGIFDMYRQVDRPDERTRGGLGIGLTLARNLVRLHGGTIEARSEGPGRGSEFIVRLPLLSAEVARKSDGADSVGVRAAEPSGQTRRAYP